MVKANPTTEIIDVPKHLREPIETTLGRKLRRLRCYGNIRLLEHTRMRFTVEGGLIYKHASSEILDELEIETERQVLESKILVTTLAGYPAQRCAVVPLRWGSPRILVLSCGIYKALGPDLKQEPLRMCRLWRYAFDPITDLVISARTDDSGFIAFDEATSRLAAAIVGMKLE